MPSHYPTSAMGVIDDRRTEVERIQDSGAQFFKVDGEIEVDGVGEATVSVVFPVQFVTKPTLHCDWELAPGLVATPTQFPTCSSGVLYWNVAVKSDGRYQYAGATIGIVTTGSDTQVLLVSWCAEGVGTRSPNDPPA